MRNLATIQKIWKITPIEGADRIECASVLGWKCVVNKGEFREGDLCVYFEIDSFLPEMPAFEFLRPSSYKKTDWQGNGFLIRTRKLKGQVSQGLVLPLSAVRDADPGADLGNFHEGDDVSGIFSVQKFDPPETFTGTGTVKGTVPFGIYHTDETRVQSAPGVLAELKGLPYYITSKMDGTSVTMYVKDGKFGVTGHTREYVLDDGCAFYVWAKKHGIEERLKSLGRDIAFQGEFCGPKIQSNRIGLKELSWYVFNIQDLDSLGFLPFEELERLTARLGLDMVPVVEKGGSFNYTEEELLAKADGLYPTGRVREGIVVRPQEEVYSAALKGRLSFKVINNKYLLKNGP